MLYSPKIAGWSNLPAGPPTGGQAGRWQLIQCMYNIYALYFEKSIYVGMTDNIERRIREHRSGKTKSTRNKGVFSLRIIEECSDRKQARLREKYWKSGCGKEKLKIAGWSNGSSDGS